MSQASQRVLSIDAVRGLTIAGMILVNNPGTWRHIYPPLRHAEWNGCTPTDLVFPFFLFLVGVSMWFSLSKRRAAGDSRVWLFAHVFRRSLILVCLGLIMYGFPNFRLIGPEILAIVGVSMLFTGGAASGGGVSTGLMTTRIAGALILAAAVVYFRWDIGYFNAIGLRVPGVLQRIGLSYLLASVVVLAFGWRGAAIGAALLIAGYAVILSAVQPPAGYTADVTHPDGLLHNWIDEQFLEGHLYRERPDPEGLLSTVGAVATVLLGVMTGRWLRVERSGAEKAVGLFVAASFAIFVGLCMDHAYPIGKKIWSPSYVVYTAGIALQVIAVCYWLIDVRGYWRWSWPFLVFGSNAIVVFVASSLLAKMMGRWKVTGQDGLISVHGYLYNHVAGVIGDAKLASLAYAVAYILFWFVLLIPLYRRRWFVRI